MRMWYVYKLTDPSTGKAYIGLTQNLVERMRGHKSIRKWVSDGRVKHEVLCTAPTVKQGRILEQAMILQHGTLHPGGYNLCVDHRMTGKKQSPETIAKIAAAATGRKHSDAARAKMSASRKGKKEPAAVTLKRMQSRKGYVHSGETRRKISEANRGRKHPQTYKDACRERALGRKASAATVEKMRNAQLDLKRTISQEQLTNLLAAGKAWRAQNPEKIGRNKSAETREKISSALTGKKRDENFREKCRLRMTGVKQSPETIARRMETIRKNRMKRLT